MGVQEDRWEYRRIDGSTGGYMGLQEDRWDTGG